MEQFPVTLIILNGKGAENDILRSAVKVMREEGYTLHIRVTWEKGDAIRYVEEASRIGADTVVAGGGDGTINEVATALAQLAPELRPVLGILPLGTANDFATSVGIPQELDKALQLAIVGKGVDIDLVQVNESYFFINMATGGFGTRITTETPEKLKAALGGIAYFVHGLIRLDTLKPDRCEIRGEDFEWQGDALVIGIGNGRQEELLPAIFKTLTQSDDNPNIIDGRSSWFEITAPHDITFNLDGEPLTSQKFRIDIHPNALSCRLPPNCPLLG